MARPKVENGPNPETMEDMNIALGRQEKKGAGQVQPLIEEVITGHSAQRLHDLLTKPPKDPRRQEIIHGAVKKFPEPGHPSAIDIDL